MRAKAGTRAFIIHRQDYGEAAGYRLRLYSCGQTPVTAVTAQAGYWLYIGAPEVSDVNGRYKPLATPRIFIKSVAILHHFFTKKLFAQDQWVAISRGPKSSAPTTSVRKSEAADLKY